MIHYRAPRCACVLEAPVLFLLPRRTFSMAFAVPIRRWRARALARALVELPRTWNFREFRRTSCEPASLPAFRISSYGNCTIDPAICPTERETERERERCVSSRSVACTLQSSCDFNAWACVPLKFFLSRFLQRNRSSFRVLRARRFAFGRREIYTPIRHSTFEG
jgi:hypothetical protein